MVGGIANGFVQRSAHMAGEMAFKQALKLRGGFADQESRAHIFIKRIKPRQAIVFCAPADNPVNILICGERVPRRLGIRRLAVIDEDQIFVAPTGCRRWASPGKSSKACCRSFMS